MAVSLNPDLERILKGYPRSLNVVGCAFVRPNGSMIAVKLPSGEGRQIIAALSTTINDVARRYIVLVAVISESNLDLTLIKMGRQNM